MVKEYIDIPLTEEEVEKMTGAELTSRETMTRLFSVPGEVDRAFLISAIKNRARALRCLGEVNGFIRAYEKELRALDMPKNKTDFFLESDGHGGVKCSLLNYENILRYDPHFKGLRFNLLSHAPEKREQDGSIRGWRGSDDTLALGYIYKKYKIHNQQMCLNAITNVLTEREYHPIKETIEGLKWDGEPRIEQFLCFSLKCDDTPYVREVSRLIFAGGIHRVYEPGCKFDNVPVLIGTRQGEGKSTVIRWLALEDKHFTEVITIEGKEGVEGLMGKWICELAELMAVTRTKEVEAVKAFLSRSTDHTRQAYDRRVSDYPRQCIFIGSTNKEQFLTDKTGNRRFFPVKVHTERYEVHSREDEIKEYIKQCWAEAKALYDEGRLPPYPDRALMDEIEENQAAAVEDDWRVDDIRNYLESTNEDRVCVKLLWYKALGMSEYTTPSRKDSNEIGLIMQNFPEWERKEQLWISEYKKRFKGWQRKDSDKNNDFGCF